MEKTASRSNFSASRLTASTFGALAGVGGIIHGVGEVLQGSVPPEGIFFPSWTTGPIAERMGGDPGMSILPNLLFTGMLAILISCLVIAWSLRFVHRKRSGLVLILLSIGMLLFGGGVGPPIIGVLAGIAATAINSPLTWWRRNLPTFLTRFLAGLFPWVFGICALNGLFLFLGAIILIAILNIGNASLFLNSFFIATLSFPLMIVTGIAFDIRSREMQAAVPAPQTAKL
jgi:hypothetical protein